MTFIYVFSKDAKERLEALNFTLFKSDDAQEIYIFLNDPESDIGSADVSYVMSDSITL